MPEPIQTPSLVWRTAGGDNSRRGLFARAVQVDPTPLRRLPAQGAVQAAVVFDQHGTAFVADMSGGVQAFSDKGREHWRVKLTGGVSAAPVVHPTAPRVFVGTHAGWVHALHTSNGETVWRKEVPTKSDPRILSDLLHLPQADVVVFSSWGGRFLALDAGTGAERFSWNAGISPYSAAAADRDGNLYCLRASADQGVEFVRVTPKGEETVLHRQPEGKRGARRALVAAAPVLDEDRGVAYSVFNRDQGAELCAWSLKSGGIVWRRELSASVRATPAVLKSGTVVAVDLAGFVLGVDPDGEVRFRYATGTEYLLAGGVAEEGGTLFLGDPVGRLHELDHRGLGRIIFEAPRAIQARPSFSPDGSLHVPCADRAVHVFRSRPPGKQSAAARI